VGTTLFTILWSTTASAVSGGVQTAIFPEGLDYISSVVSGMELDFSEPQIGMSYDCYDELGILDYNLNIPIDDLEITLSENRINIRVEFGTIYGENMVAYGKDENWLDACIEFETDVNYISVTDSVFEVSLLPIIENGDIELEVMGEPSYTGEIDIDIGWIPDDLILFFWGETIFETIGQTSKSMITELFSEYWSASLLSAQLDEFDVSVGLGDIDTTATSIAVGGDMMVQWTGEPTCQTEEYTGGFGRQTQIDFGNGYESAIGLGATEAEVNKLFVGLWEDGYLCFTEDRMELLWDQLEGLFDPSVGGIQASAVFLAPPLIDMRPDDSEVSMDGVEIQITGVVDGYLVELAYAKISATAELSLALDTSITSLTMSLHELDLTVDELRAEHLLSSQEGAEDYLVGFMEGWLSTWVASEFDDVILFATQFYTFDTYVRVQDVIWGDAEMKTFIKLYDENDPAVDKVPPETNVSLSTLSNDAKSASFDVTVTDDREDPIAISWSLDEQTWSSWTVTDTVELSGLMDGEHTLLVKSRDSWLNEDQTPASITFEIIPVVETTEPSNCACSVTPANRRTGMFWGALLAVAAIVRRKR